MIVEKNDLLSVADYYTIMRQKGYYTGYYGSVMVNDIEGEIKEKLGDNLLIAKGMFILFYVNENIPSSILEHIWDKVGSLVKEDVSIVVNSEIDNRISVDMVEYEVLLSGMQKLGKGMQE